MNYENDVFDENDTNILLDEENLWFIDKNTRKRDSNQFDFGPNSCNNFISSRIELKLKLNIMKLRNILFMKNSGNSIHN